jgi:hypothetical protein
MTSRHQIQKFTALSILFHFLKSVPYPEGGSSVNPEKNIFCLLSSLVNFPELELPVPEVVLLIFMSLLFLG